MTPELELLFETSIDRVAKNISSIYTTEDVIIILKTFRQAIDELPKATSVTYNHDEIVRAFNDILDEYSFEEFVSCEPELQGSYGDSYSLEMNTSFDDREFRRCMINDLQNYFAPNEEEL